MQIKKCYLKAVNSKDDKCGVLIDTAQGELWFNGFANERTKQLNKEETVWLWLYQSRNGDKVYNNFKLPSIDQLFAMMNVDDKKISPQTPQNGSVSTPTAQNVPTPQPTQITPTEDEINEIAKNW